MFFNQLPGLLELFRTLSEKLLNFLRRCFGRLSKLLFLFPVEHFASENFLWSSSFNHFQTLSGKKSAVWWNLLSKFHQFQTLARKCSTVWRVFLWQGFQNCFLRAHSKILNKPILLKKKLSGLFIPCRRFNKKTSA